MWQPPSEKIRFVVGVRNYCCHRCGHNKALPLCPELFCCSVIPPAVDCLPHSVHSVGRSAASRQFGDFPFCLSILASVSHSGRTLPLLPLLILRLCSSVSGIPRRRSP